jgi:hypothetical protein
MFVITCANVLYGKMLFFFFFSNVCYNNVTIIATTALTLLTAVSYCLNYFLFADTCLTTTLYTICFLLLGAGPEPLDFADVGCFLTIWIKYQCAVSVG